jgi:hypothetical protein
MIHTTLGELELAAKVFESARRGRAARCCLRDRIRAAIVDDHLMSALDQTRRHVRAHLAQSIHPDLHS